MDYNKNIWGGSLVKLSWNYLGYLRLKHAIDDLKDVKGKVLEVGCGGGGFIGGVGVYRKDLKLFGIDINRMAIKSASEQFKKIKFTVSSIYRLPFKDNYFDAVIVEDVLEHLDRPEKAVGEISRVMKKGGVLSSYIPLEGVWYGLHFWFELLGWKYKEKYVGHIQKYKLRDLFNMFKKENLKVEKYNYGPHLLGQIIDIGIYTYAGLKGNFEPGLEANLKNPILILSKNIITVITNLESILFSKIPGAGVYLKCIKKQ